MYWNTEVVKILIQPTNWKSVNMKLPGILRVSSLSWRCHEQGEVTRTWGSGSNIFKISELEFSDDWQMNSVLITDIMKNWIILIEAQAEDWGMSFLGTGLYRDLFWEMTLGNGHLFASFSFIKASKCTKQDLRFVNMIFVNIM